MLEPTFEIARKGDWFLLRAVGEFDMATAPLLRQQIITLVSKGARNVILDLNGVDFIDSTGLGVIVGAVKRLRMVEGDLRVVCDRPHLVELFEITRLSSVFDLFPSLDAATPVESA